MILQFTMNASRQLNKLSFKLTPSRGAEEGRTRQSLSRFCVPPPHLPAAPPQSEPLDLPDYRTSFTQPLSFLSTGMERHSAILSLQPTTNTIPFSSKLFQNKGLLCQLTAKEKIIKINFEQNSELLSTLFSGANSTLKKKIQRRFWKIRSWIRPI